MDIPVAVVIPIITGIIGVTTWNVSLQGRVNGHDKLFDEREKLGDERHGDLKERLERIEDKLDRTLQLKR